MSLSVYSAFVRFALQSLTWALDVADDAAGGVVHELDADLGHTATGACSPQEVSISQAVLHIVIDWMAFSASEGRGEARRQCERQDGRTGAAEDAGDLDELDGNLGALHFVRSWSMRRSSIGIEKGR